MSVIAPEAVHNVLGQTTQPTLAAFDSLKAGSPAPFWLFRGVAAAWCLDPDRIDLRLMTVSENATFRLSLDGRAIGAVRVSQPGYAGGADAIVSELTWIQALREALAEVDIIEPVPSPRGPYLAIVKDNSGTGWMCVSTRYVDGRPLEDLRDPAQHYRIIGRWTALFHQQARAWTLPRGFRRFTWDIDDMVGPSCRWGRWETVARLPDSELALLTRAQELALTLLEDLPKNSETWGLIHADLRPANVLVAGDKLTVIDFDDSGFSYYLYDYAAALTLVEHHSYAPAMATEWMAGYQEVTPLSSKEILHASALSMVRRLQGLGWTGGHREDALPDGLFAEQLPGTVEVARHFLKSPTWLLD
ncbi:MAG: phosphotransferase [Bifidobacteriaceae bacterium]|jgi:Ser/Thr protein kinase RdoA (MazF antagonist)|nr:phosphotransferase [Bifidobacteriaceae bacterium]